jgi:hypothetical protein
MVPNSYAQLALISGMLCKIYDDFHDNNLYEAFGIKHDVILFFNEALKSSFLLTSGALAIKYPIFVVGWLVSMFVLFVLRPSDLSHPYEFSCFIAPFVLMPFSEWNNDVQYFKNGLFWCEIAGGTLLFEGWMDISSTEFGMSKLVSRIIELVLCICSITHPAFSPFPATDSIRVSVYWMVGYLCISCIMQYLLINKIVTGGAIDGIDGETANTDEVTPLGPPKVNDETISPAKPKLKVDSSSAKEATLCLHMH